MQVLLVNGHSTDGEPLRSIVHNEFEPARLIEADNQAELNLALHHTPFDLERASLLHGRAIRLQAVLADDPEAMPAARAFFPSGLGARSV